MTKIKNKIERITGLTLIEALFVILILSVLVGSLYVVFKSGMESWKKSESKLEIYQNGRIIVEQIQRELSQAFLIPGNVSIYFLGNVSGSVIKPNSTGDEVFFLAPTNSDATAPNPNCEMGFWMDNQRTLRRFYVTSSSANYDFNYSTPNTLLNSNELAFNVTGLEFYYWDGDPTNGTQNWNVYNAGSNPRGARRTWDSRSTSSVATQIGKLPRAVKVRITLSENVSLEPETRVFESVVYLPNSEGQ